MLEEIAHKSCRVRCHDRDRKISYVDSRNDDKKSRRQ